MSAATQSAYPSLSPQELAQARLLIDQTRNCVIGATRLLAGAQWTFRPSPDRWSAGENLEHMVNVQDRVLAMLAEQLPSAPPPPAGFDAAAVDSVVIHQFSTRLGKFPAPPTVHPAGVDPAETLSRFEQNCRRLHERLDAGRLLREHAIEAAPIKALTNGAFTVMDGYQWLLALAGHSERHAKQILESSPTLRSRSSPDLLCGAVLTAPPPCSMRPLRMFFASRLPRRRLSPVPQTTAGMMFFLHGGVSSRSSSVFRAKRSRASGASH